MSSTTKYVIPLILFNHIPKEKFVKSKSFSITKKYSDFKGIVNLDDFTDMDTEHSVFFCENIDTNIKRNCITGTKTEYTNDKILKETLILSFDKLPRNDAKNIIDCLVKESELFQYIYEIFEKIDYEDDSLVAKYFICGVKYFKDWS